MLLNEVVLKPRVRNDAEDRWEYDVDWDQSSIQPVGVQIVRVRPHHEELELFNQHGFDQKRLPTFPVIYAYTYTKKAPTGSVENDDGNDDNQIRGGMHALKARNPRHHMNSETLKDIYVKGLEKIKNTNNFGKSVEWWNKRKAKLDAYKKPIPLTDKEQEEWEHREGFNRLKSLIKGGNKNNVVLLPVASSSVITMNVTKAMSEVMGGAHIVSALSKQLPTHSSHLYTQERGYEPRDNVINPQEQFQGWQDTLVKLRKALVDLNNNEELMTKDEDAWTEKYTTLQDKINKLERKVAAGWQIKNAGGPHMQDNTRGFFNFQQANPALKHELEDKIIVMIDDNIDSSATMADAYKALLRIGIKPKSVIGLCPQKYS